MRVPFLIPSILAAFALSLSGCGKNDQAANTTNVDETLAAENIVSNDVTAIDAVTGDASNMAADVNYTEELNVENATGNEKAPNVPTPRKPAPGKPPLEQPEYLVRLQRQAPFRENWGQFKLPPCPFTYGSACARPTPR